MSSQAPQAKNLKELADELIKIKGNIKGTIFHAHEAFIRSRQGEEGVKLVEKKTRELGYPVNFKEIRPFAWYPDALSVLVVIVAKEVFNWSQKEVFEMGKAAPKVSMIIRLLLKHFVSIKKVFEECPKFWHRHVDFGSFENIDFNEKEKYAVVRITWPGFHPLICVWLAGYIYGIASLVLNKVIKVEEIKCGFRGDPYHEYKVTWE